MVHDTASTTVDRFGYKQEFDRSLRRFGHPWGRRVPVFVGAALSCLCILIGARIENPYHEGAPAQPGNRMALENIRERLALFFDAEARIETRISDDRYRVEIEIPYRVASR